MPPRSLPSLTPPRPYRRRRQNGSGAGWTCSSHMCGGRHVPLARHPYAYRPPIPLALTAALTRGEEGIPASAAARGPGVGPDRARKRARGRRLLGERGRGGAPAAGRRSWMMPSRCRLSISEKRKLGGGRNTATPPARCSSRPVTDTPQGSAPRLHTHGPHEARLLALRKEQLPPQELQAVPRRPRRREGGTSTARTHRAPAYGANAAVGRARHPLGGTCPGRTRRGLTGTQCAREPTKGRAQKAPGHTHPTIEAAIPRRRTTWQ